MRARLALLAACALMSCEKQEPKKASPAKQGQIERWYEDWAARQPRPTPQLVDHIEALLVRSPCIGDLKRWSRSYAYDMLPERTVDTGIVDFHFEEAGAENVKAGRHVSAPFMANIDDRPIKMVDGDYDIREDRIRIGWCAQNVGATQSDVDKARRYWAEKGRRRAEHGTKAR
jgi:hypothetical protein